MKPRYLIIVSQWNELITQSLERAAQSYLAEQDIDAVETVWVPGSFELPVTAKCAADTGKYSAIICLGAVIKGDTPHFDLVAGQCAAGLMKVAVDSGVPVCFGVLTTNTVEEALNRAGLKMGNKGREAAETAVRMTKVLKSFKK